MTDETLAERLARCVKPLSWERLDDTGRFWRAPAPLFGNIRVEAYGGPYRIAYSVPGFSHTFTEGEFDTPEVAMRAAQADYQSRILAALDMDALAQEVEAMVGWRDIATAPKDGTEILVWAQWDWEGMAGDRTDSDFAWRVAVWDEPPSKPSAFWSVSENPYSDLAVRATLWRPLPPPPSAPAKEGSRDER
jgi:hypothetical protein